MYFLIEIRSLLFFRQESTGPQGHPPRYHLKEYIINVLNIDIFPIFIFLSSSSIFSFFFFFFLSSCVYFLFFLRRRRKKKKKFHTRAVVPVLLREEC